MNKKNHAFGQLYLVSIGIGDNDNMTVRAQQTILDADIVLGMDFVCESVAYLTQGKQILDAGHCLFTPMAFSKKEPEEVMQQETAIRNIIETAIQNGKKVVVLDFGDPMMFGPQAGYLTEFSHFDPVVVPGISSVNAANALFGRPLWRQKDSRVVITTLEGFKLQKPPYPEVTVFFTMQQPLDQTINELTALCGPTTPIALVFHAGFKQKQKIFLGTLENILHQLGAIEEIPWDYLAYVGSGLIKEGWD